MSNKLFFRRTLNEQVDGAHERQQRVDQLDRVLHQQTQQQQ